MRARNSNRSSATRGADCSAKVVVNDLHRRVQRQCDQAKRGAGEQQEAVADDIDRRLHDAVEDTETDIAPSQPQIDRAAEIHQCEAYRYRIEERRLLHQMIVIMGLPLGAVVDATVELGTART